MPLLLGAAAARRLVVPCSSQRWLCRVPFGGVGSCFAFPTIALVRSTPAPDWFVLARPKVALACAIWRGSLFKVCSSCRRCVLRASNGFSANDGGDAGGEAAQNRARRFPDQASLPRKCRARFTALRRASPPIHWFAPRCGARRGASPAKVVVVSVRLGRHRARPTGEPARVSPRAGFAYSLAKGTLQGRCGNTSRRARESFSRPEKARVGCYQLPCVDGASGAVGCCGAAVSRHFANCLDRQTQAPRHFGGLRGTWRCVCNAGKPCGPKRSADGRARQPG